MTGNLVANISRRTLLLASCSLAGVPERSYAQARAMIHIILLGDSVFDSENLQSRCLDQPGSDLARPDTDALNEDGPFVPTNPK